MVDFDDIEIVVTDDAHTTEDEVFGLLDSGYSKEETAKLCEVSVEVIDALLERLNSYAAHHRWQQ
jgi:hypothetical protein